MYVWFYCDIGVKAAFDKLEKSRQQMFVSTIQDYHEAASAAGGDCVEVVSEEPAIDRIKVSLAQRHSSR